MAQATRVSLRQLGAAVRTLLALTVILGLAYPLAMTGIAQGAFSGNADGSLVHVDGTPVGSDLIGQAFVDEDGAALPQYFQPRPSAAGDGYDPLSTSASNLGAENPDLIEAVMQRRAEVAARDGVPPSEVAPDALLASASGLDPHISPDYAEQQVVRVAGTRGIAPDRVRELVDEHTSGRVIGFLGEEGVNVLQLNLALDRLTG
jgi:K+-transporting ATPase ATPase C chain